MSSTTRTFLAGCTTMAAALSAVFLLTAAKDGPTHANFDEITVGRINIVEPDGQKRLIISNRAQFPGSFHQGKEIARPDRRDFAGMLFVDEEGNENGGFLQKGIKTPDGKITAGLSLTFDRYRQDQAMQLKHLNDERHASSSLTFNDVPHHALSPIDDFPKFHEEANALPESERRAFWNKLAEEGKLSQPRVKLGTTPRKDSILMLNDAKGRARMRLMVSASGKAAIEMLDETGKVVKTIGPDQ